MIHYAHADAVGVILKDAHGVKYIPYHGRPRRQVLSRPELPLKVILPPTQPITNSVLPASFSFLDVLEPLLG